MTTYLHSMISLPSIEFVKWVQIVSITNSVRDSHCTFFCKYITQSECAKRNCYMDSLCVSLCVCVAFFFSFATSFLFQSLASFSPIDLSRCVPIQCNVFEWNFIYLECSRNAVLKATIGIDTTISRFQNQRLQLSLLKQNVEADE